MFKSLSKCAFIIGIAVSFLNADQISLNLVSVGTIGGSSIFKADLTEIGLTQIGSITITDDGTPVGGADGIFSGFDLDALFLDVDGNLLTAGDRYFASEYLFTAGTTRPTSLNYMNPSTTHPGPTFGSLNSTTIDYATATLNSFDGVSIADVNSAAGFLTLGDGGVIVANFSPVIPVGSSLYLATGEVGGQQGEFLDAFVTVSTQPSSVPEPTILVLLFGGIICLIPCRKFKNKKV
jgi:hypothetical protein